MIVDTGVDIIETARFEKEDSVRFTKRCFTEREQAYLCSRSAQSRAGLFAAKEAVVKALGAGFYGFWPSDVEILHDARGKPYVVMHGEARRAAKRLRVSRISLSISHNRTTAVAVAVAERTEGHAGRSRRANARHRSVRR